MFDDKRNFLRISAPPILFFALTSINGSKCNTFRELPANKLTPDIAVMLGEANASETNIQNRVNITPR